MEPEVSVEVSVFVDGSRFRYDLDSDGLAARGSNPSPSMLADEIAETMQRAVWDGEGQLRSLPF